MKMTELRWGLLGVALVAPSTWFLDLGISKFVPEFLSVLTAAALSATFWLVVVVLGMIALRKLAR